MYGKIGNIYKYIIDSLTNIYIYIIDYKFNFEYYNLFLFEDSIPNDVIDVYLNIIINNNV